MGLTLIQAPSEEPITVEEAKASPSLRITTAANDTDIGTLIATARDTAETITRRAFVTQTWELVLDGFPSGGIVVPLPPLQSVASIKYIDDNGDQQTLNPLLYAVDTDSEPGLVVPAYGETWPSTRDEVNAVRVRFVAGYGSKDNVPEAIKTWIKMRVGTLFVNSTTIVTGTIVEALKRDYVDGLLDPYRVITF